MVPLVQGMSQLKWVWFSSKPRPLADFQLYDEASRGPWGGVKILFKLKGYFSSHAQSLLQYTNALPQVPRQPRRADYTKRHLDVHSDAAGATIPDKLSRVPEPNSPSPTMFQL